MHRMMLTAALALGAAPVLAQSDPATRIEPPAPAARDAQDAAPAEDAQRDASDGSAKPSNMVSVTIPSVDVLGDFVSDSDAKALDSAGLPMTVDLPLGIAANACGADQADLAKRMKDGGASCTAQNGSRALAEAVKKAGAKPE